MPPNDLLRYKPLFLQTAWDYVRQLEHSLHILASDPHNSSAIASVHLCSHSLKSQCAVMQFDELSGVCRHIEEDFKGIKDDGKELSSTQVTQLLLVVAGIKESLANISSGDEEKDMSNERKTLGMQDPKGESI